MHARGILALISLTMMVTLVIQADGKLYVECIGPTTYYCHENNK